MTNKTGSAAENKSEPPLAPPVKKSILKKICKGVALLVVIGLVLVAYDAALFLTKPASKTPVDITFYIAPGTSFDQVASKLYEQGLIKDLMRFRILAKVRKDVVKIQAGEFVLNTGWKPGEILTQLTIGKPVLYKLVIREGLSWWETGKAIEAQGFALFDDFKEIIHDPAFLKEHYIPFTNAEGFLFPETYSLQKPKNLTREEQKKEARKIASLMVKTFWTKSKPLWSTLPSRDTEIPWIFAAPRQHQMTWPMEANPTPLEKPEQVDPLSLYVWLALASLVEKETSMQSERPTIAGVFANRLRAGMLLQCDPTIAYGIGESFSGTIRRSHLQDKENIYNTYIHGGLPPSPIASTGMAALKASLVPEKHNLYYFVATGLDGSHKFSRTLQEHNRAVQEYRMNVRNSN